MNFAKISNRPVNCIKYNFCSYSFGASVDSRPKLVWSHYILWIVKFNFILSIVLSLATSGKRITTNTNLAAVVTNIQKAHYKKYTKRV